MQESDPGKMKQFTRNLPHFNRQEWETHSEDIGYTAVLNKFQQNQDLHKYLMDTGEKLLVEASVYDTLWGIGLRLDDPEIMAKKC